MIFYFHPFSKTWMMGPTCSLMLWNVLLWFFFTSLFFFQTHIVSVSRGCLCLHQAWVPPWEHCAGVTTCLGLTRSKLLCITSLSLLISLISLQAVGRLSTGALPAIFSLLTMKFSVAGAIAMPVTFWCCSKLLSASTSFWSRFHTSLARSDSCLRD